MCWLLLFKVLSKKLSLCLVSCGICCSMLSVDSVILNYLSWKCLFAPEISSGYKSSIIDSQLYEAQRPYYWDMSPLFDHFFLTWLDCSYEGYFFSKIRFVIALIFTTKVIFFSKNQSFSKSIQFSTILHFVCHFKILFLLIKNEFSE